MPQPDEDGDGPSRPLLDASRGEAEQEPPPGAGGERPSSPGPGLGRLRRLHRAAEDAHPAYRRRRRRAQALLMSRRKHYLVLGLVALDVAGILADIFIALVSCDMGAEGEPWVRRARDGLGLAGLVFSCLFLLELVLCVWAFGFQYFNSWFHVFDGLIIVASFVVDLVTRGIVEEIASLVIMLRLWRFVKIVEELSVGASERMEEVELQLERLEEENEKLRNELGTARGGAGAGRDDEQ